MCFNITDLIADKIHELYTVSTGKMSPCDTCECYSRECWCEEKDDWLTDLENVVVGSLQGLIDYYNHMNNEDIKEDRE